MQIQNDRTHKPKWIIQYTQNLKVDNMFTKQMTKLYNIQSQNTRLHDIQTNCKVIQIYNYKTLNAKLCNIQSKECKKIQKKHDTKAKTALLLFWLTDRRNMFHVRSARKITTERLHTEEWRHKMTRAWRDNPTRVVARNWLYTEQDSVHSFDPLFFCDGKTTVTPLSVG